MIVGDFNAKPASEFFNLWLAASEQCNFNVSRRRNQFVQAVNFELDIWLSEIILCISSDCAQEAHVADLDSFWETFVGTVRVVDFETFGTQVPNKFITPGWKCLGKISFFF